jgi:hypothetical protein
MPRDKDEGATLLDAPKDQAPVLMVGLGRGGSGKSLLLAEAAWRARSQGRQVIIADGDARSKTLLGLFPGAMTPASEELPDVKQFLSSLLNRMVREQRSAVLDLGGGDRSLLEYGRDLRLVEFCARRGIEPLGLYVLGPEDEDLAHVVSIFDGGYFRPRRTLLVLNEGVIRTGRTVAGAFERTLASPAFAKLVEAGAVPLLLTRLAAMDQVKQVSGGFYEAASGDALDPVEGFMLEDWLIDLERKRRDAGAADWLP